MTNANKLKEAEITLLTAAAKFIEALGGGATVIGGITIMPGYGHDFSLTIGFTGYAPKPKVEMDTPLFRAHNMIRSIINTDGNVSKYWIEDALELLSKDDVKNE